MKKIFLQVRHFLDFTPDGPLCHVLSILHQFKHEQGWRRFDFSSPSRKVTFVLFIPYFGFLYFGHFSFFPSCFAKCRQRLRNIFVILSPKVIKNEKWDELYDMEMNVYNLTVLSLIID